MKKCSRCQLPKKASEFHRRTRSSDGLQPACKECLKPYQAAMHRKHRVSRALAKKEYAKKHPEINAKSTIKYRRDHPEKAFAARIKHLYGLTIVEFNALVEKQKGRCAMCSEARKLCIDHDHITGKVRALLCFSCNKAIGFLKDSSAVASNAVSYLKSHDR